MSKDQNLNTGLYYITKDYRIVMMNKLVTEWYPEVNIGDFCYKAFALMDEPCPTCPLIDNNALFYTSARRGWISSTAASIDLPQFGGECYSIQFKRILTEGETKREKVRLEKVDEYIKDLNGSIKGNECVFSGYCEKGAPIFYANNNMIELLGYDNFDDMYDRCDGLMLNLLHPNDRDQLKDSMRSLRVKNAVFEFNCRMQRKDGSWILIISRGKAIKTAEGKMATFCICNDVSSLLANQKILQTENYELLKEEELQESLMLRLPGGYHRCHASEGYPFLYISESFQEIVGWSKEEIKSEFDNKFLNIVFPEDLPKFDDLVNQIENGGSGSNIYRLKKKGGGFVWVQDSTMYVEKGKDSFYQCTVANITDFIEQQEGLILENSAYQAKELLFDKIAKNMPSGYHRCGVGEGFPLSFISDSFIDIVGWSKEEIEKELDNNYLNIVAPEDLELFLSLEPELRENGKITAVYRIRKKDGTRRWIQDSTVRVTQNNDTFYQCTLADITEHVEKLNDEKHKAEASSRAKSRFLFNASHDIRTPMNAIYGFTQILKNNLDKPELVRETLEKIEKSSETLNMLLSGVLELSRIESGKEDLNIVATDLTEHTDNLFNMFNNEIQKSEIEFTSVKDIKNSLVMCDPLKLTQIGMNMLSNAKKFTPAGGKIKFGIVELPCEEEGYGIYRFFCKDTGIGMSEEFQQRAFEQFERERSTTNSGIIGSGLGMAIIKRTVDLFGGECKLESKLGEGTEISAIIKLKTANNNNIPAAAAAMADSELNFKGKRILLVEDNDFNREIATYILESSDFTVEEAENGAIAVDKLLNAEEGYYDLVLMDIQMPVMDGYTATEEIRNIKNPKIANIPIIAMTANAFSEDKEKCIQVGMNGHLAKPIDTKLLINELAKVL